MELVDFWEIYLFCLIDHFSKYTKCYLLQSITVLKKFKWFNKYIGKLKSFIVIKMENSVQQYYYFVMEIKLN